MATTVGCKQCGWLTDIELTSDTNPSRCPECGETIFLSGFDELSDDPLYVDGEYNPMLFEDEDEDEDESDPGEMVGRINDAILKSGAFNSDLLQGELLAIECATGHGLPSPSLTRAEVYDAVHQFELNRLRAAGSHGRGNWCYLRVYSDPLRIIEGAEPSPCYPESEYFNHDGSPITVHAATEIFSPDPDSGLVWEDDPDGEYVRTSTGGWHPIDDLNNDELGEVIRNGGSRFRLGADVADPLDIDDLVDEIIKTIEEHFGVTIN